MQKRAPSRGSSKVNSVTRVLFVGAEEVRATAERTLAREARMRIVGVASDIASALQSMSALQFDSVLVDAAVLGPDTASTVRCLTHDSGKRVPVVVLGGEADEYAAARLLAAGALGYLAGGAVDSELPEAIATAQAGRCYISSSLRDRMAFKYIDNA